MLCFLFVPKNRGFPNVINSFRWRAINTHTNFSRRIQPHYREVPVSNSDVSPICMPFPRFSPNLQENHPDFVISILTHTHTHTHGQGVPTVISRRRLAPLFPLSLYTPTHLNRYPRTFRRCGGIKTLINRFCIPVYERQPPLPPP